jgi:hypothetical protein
MSRSTGEPSVLVVVLGEQPVQGLSRLGEDASRFGDLRGGSGGHDLQRGGSDLLEQVEHLRDVVAGRVAQRLPRRGVLLGVRARLGAAAGGQTEDAPAAR